jgi:hypothetical protein
VNPSPGCCKRICQDLSLSLQDTVVILTADQQIIKPTKRNQEASTKTRIMRGSFSPQGTKKSAPTGGAKDRRRGKSQGTSAAHQLSELTEQVTPELQNSHISPRTGEKTIGESRRDSLVGNLGTRWTPPEFSSVGLNPRREERFFRHHGCCLSAEERGGVLLFYC